MMKNVICSPHIKFVFILGIMFQYSISMGQTRYEITMDTTINHCSVFEIKDGVKEFAVHEFNNCIKVELFDNNNLIVVWDQNKDCHIRNISRGFGSKDEPVFVSDIKAIISITKSNTKTPYSKNSAATSEYLYIIKYMDADGSNCEMDVEPYWFMTFSKSCQE